jgi:ubiquinone/menaquinone biosynthesis C-methylase UbiE/uncharacterized protein YbaR (Trm112 family)
MAPPRSDLVALLRCLSCGSALADDGEAALTCTGCQRRYPVRDGTVRMIDGGTVGADEEATVKTRTAESFAYEWQRFGGLRPEWRKNFLDYLQPLDPAWLEGKLVLDVGAGSGRHSFQAHAAGARVVAVDLGDSIDVARANLPPEVLTVQCDAERLPFAPQTFDLVMSIGVLHHLPDTERALRGLPRFVRPGGRLHVYLYWKPPVRWHRTVLDLVTAARRVTTRMPHRLLHALCYPLAAVLYVTFVAPYRALRRRPRGRKLVAGLPLKTYADYPFGVCVNDQFDRLSAPLERRFEREEVEALLRSADLADITVLPNHGWVGSGRVSSY